MTCDASRSRLHQRQHGCHIVSTSSFFKPSLEHLGSIALILHGCPKNLATVLGIRIIASKSPTLLDAPRIANRLPSERKPRGPSGRRGRTVRQKTVVGSGGFRTMENITPPWDPREDVNGHAYTCVNGHFMRRGCCQGKGVVTIFA